MKRVYIFLVSALSLLFISTIILGSFGFFEITLTFTPLVDTTTIFFILFGITIGGPFVLWFLFFLGRFISGLFKPKFVRIADNLERVIKQKDGISYKLGISLKKEHLIDKMEHIWRKADMQYPLSELDFEKIMGGDHNA